MPPRAAIARVAAFAAVLAAGCSSKLEALADNDLQDKSYACQHTADPSPGFAIACDNYRRECTRRRGEGRFVC